MHTKKPESQRPGHARGGRMPRRERWAGRIPFRAVARNPTPPHGRLRDGLRDYLDTAFEGTWYNAGASGYAARTRMEVSGALRAGLVKAGIDAESLYFIDRADLTKARDVEVVLGIISRYLDGAVSEGALAAAAGGGFADYPQRNDPSEWAGYFRRLYLDMVRDGLRRGGIN